MRINKKLYQTIWFDEKESKVKIIDQTKLPYKLKIISLDTLEDIIIAIKNMKVRGAPLIGATAAFGLYIAFKEKRNRECLEEASIRLKKTRPTAINLAWSIDRVLSKIKLFSDNELEDFLLKEALNICIEDKFFCKKIGEHGLNVIKSIQNLKNKKTINILTHCNAGWLATIDWGTATAPIYKAHKSGIDVHVWVDETRPRNQGSSLTSYELNNEGVPNTIIVDNAGGLLMQQGRVDLVITGADRVTANGHVVNKIGTYLKALSAKDNNIPFYVAVPSSTFDWSITDYKKIPIEERSSSELNLIEGMDADGNIRKINIYPEKSKSLNLAFDITPNKYVTGLITELGVCLPNEKSLKEIFKKP